MKQQIINFKQALLDYHSAVQGLKTLVIKEINNIEIKSNKPQYVGNGAFSVPFSAIMNSESLILDPFYYDVEKQKEKLIQIVENSKDFSFINVFEQIALSGKHKVYTGGSYYYENYSPEVVVCLCKIISEFAKVF